MNTIQDRIKSLRNEGETQIQFAERMGTTQASISRYLNGRQPDRETLIKIAERTGVTLDWLLTGKGRGPGEAPAEGAELDEVMAALARLNGVVGKEKSQIQGLLTDLLTDKDRRRDIIAHWEGLGKKPRK